MTEVSEAARQLKVLRERAGLLDARGFVIAGLGADALSALRGPLPPPFPAGRTDAAHGRLFAQKASIRAPVLALAGVDAGSAHWQGPAADRPLEPIASRRRDATWPVMGAVKGGAEGFYFNEGDARSMFQRRPCWPAPPMRCSLCRW